MLKSWASQVLQSPQLSDIQVSMHQALMDPTLDWTPYQRKLLNAWSSCCHLPNTELRPRLHKVLLSCQCESNHVSDDTVRHDVTSHNHSDGGKRNKRVDRIDSMDNSHETNGTGTDLGSNFGSSSSFSEAPFEVMVRQQANSTFSWFLVDVKNWNPFFHSLPCIQLIPIDGKQYDHLELAQQAAETFLSHLTTNANATNVANAEQQEKAWIQYGMWEWKLSKLCQHHNTNQVYQWDGVNIMKWGEKWYVLFFYFTPSPSLDAKNHFTVCVTDAILSELELSNIGREENPNISIAQLSPAWVARGFLPCHEKENDNSGFIYLLFSLQTTQTTFNDISWGSLTKQLTNIITRCSSSNKELQVEK